MVRNEHSHSPTPEDVADHYASGYEANRLQTGEGRLERARSRELLQRFLPPAPATILDVGGGPGSHACWLAQQGYEVHLIDISPLHVQLAREASRGQPEAPLASANVGDARSLSWEAETVDAVLLLGPLYTLSVSPHVRRQGLTTDSKSRVGIAYSGRAAYFSLWVFRALRQHLMVFVEGF